MDSIGGGGRIDRDDSFKSLLFLNAVFSYWSYMSGFKPWVEFRQPLITKELQEQKSFSFILANDIASQ